MEQPIRHHAYEMKQAVLNERIRDLMHAAGNPPEAKFLTEMIVTALKMGEDEMERGDIKMINTAMKELRYALKVFYPYANTNKVAIFGSARTPRDHPDYKQAREFARIIVKEGWMVITGAASGIMRAGNEGAGRANSFGVNIKLPFEQNANPEIFGDPKLINFKYFFTRKLIFVASSEATVLCPGGFGTHDEGFETLTLVQTGKAAPRPIICMDPPGSRYWSSWRNFLETQLVTRGMIDPDDIGLIHFTHNPQDAVNVIKAFYRNFHSQRYIGHRLILRIKKPLIAKKLQTLNRRYADILTKGKIRQFMKPFAEEENEKDTFHLARLAMYFNRHKYARLKAMIDEINEE